MEILNEKPKIRIFSCILIIILIFSVLPPSWGFDQSTLFGRNPSQCTQLTTDTCGEVSPSWSPDGTKIVYQKNESLVSGTGYPNNIWIMNADGGNQHALTHSSGHDSNRQPKWSHDGSKITFWGFRPFGQGGSIWTMDANGNNENKILVKSGYDSSKPTFSPDGTKIVFNSCRRYGGGPNELYIMNSTGGNVSKILNASGNNFDGRRKAKGSISHSPDGQWIVFESERAGNWDIWIVRPDGNDLTQITSESSADFYPAWSPDGTKIAFTSDRSGNSDIWILTNVQEVINGGNPDYIQITKDGSSDRQPAWSPDGTKIVFSSDRSGNWDIWTTIIGDFVDLSIVEVKPVQVLEDVDFNSDGYIDLVAGKSTAVEVVIESNGEAKNVEIVLHFNNKDYSEFAIYKSWNIDDEFRFKSYSQKKLDFKDASQKIVYFFPDNPYKSFGNHFISAEVIPPSAVEDINNSNNSLSNEVMVYDTLWNKGSGFPNLRVYFISSDWDSPNDPNYITYYKESSYYFQSVFPVSLQRFEAWANTKWSADSKDFRNLGSENDNLLNSTEFLLWAIVLEKKLKLAEPTVDRYISVMPANWFQNFTSESKEASGLIFPLIPNLVFVQVNDLPKKTLRYQTLAHEIGHSYGLRLNCEEYDPCNPTKVDNIGNKVQYGLWIEEKMLMNYQSNHSVYCFMGALKYYNASIVDYWIDLKCYEDLFDEKDTDGTKDYQIPEMYPNRGVLVSGIIYSDDTAKLDHWYQLDSMQTDFLNPGEYNIVVLNSSSNVLFEKSFRLDFTFEGRSVTQAPFAFSIPYLEDTRKVLIKHKDIVLAERIVSDNSPVTNVRSPNGGEIIRGTEEIHWDATDADNDTISYAVLFSADNGKTWNTIAVDLKDNYYSWDTSQLEEGNNYLVKVIATDSFNTGIDVSDAVFSVKKPIFQSAGSSDSDINRKMQPLAKIHINKAENLKEEILSLLQKAAQKDINISEVTNQIEKADTLLVKARESYFSGNYIAANTLALEAITLYQQIIEILETLLI